MKILYTLLFVLSVQLIHAQDAFYSLFAAEGTEWSIGQRSSVSDPMTIEEIHFLRLEGEETIDGKLYHKIYKIDSFQAEPTVIMEYLHLNSDSILYVRDIEGNEEMIFDYRLETGDTLNFDTLFQVFRGSIMYMDYDPTSPEIVTKGMININENSVLQWNMSTFGNFTQSIGSTTNMLDIFQQAVGYSTSLLCVYHNNEKIYDNPNFEACETITGIDDKNSIAQISVYPNPSSHSFIINGAKENSKFEMYNLLGNITIEGNCENHSIDVSELENGVYFIKIDNKIIKFVKN